MDVVVDLQTVRRRSDSRAGEEGYQTVHWGCERGFGADRVDGSHGESRRVESAFFLPLFLSRLSSLFETSKQTLPTICQWRWMLIAFNILFEQGNKAGVAVRMRVHGSPLTFVNAHLAGELVFSLPLPLRLILTTNIQKRTHPARRSVFVRSSRRQPSPINWKNDDSTTRKSPRGSSSLTFHLRLQSRKSERLIHISLPVSIAHLSLSLSLPFNLSRPR